MIAEIFAGPRVSERLTGYETKRLKDSLIMLVNGILCCFNSNQYSIKAGQIICF